MRQHNRHFHVHIPLDMNNFLNQFKGKELIEAYIPEYLHTEKLNQLKTSEQADKSVDEIVFLENIGKIIREILLSFDINYHYSVNKQTEESRTT
ncbi:unnamed protein product [Rotaria sp. Silwood2]|nr:unnamed protein product [Rotaria sp. Silwood2]CAF3199908.1 unnamed protein product [Rotaria sp. Silwood2]CAF4261534.1 unnamed protein product [Rotaria sp. Silwood2]CAF4422504.1 unnamed protein product [Rotaria sp. Silwood2]